MKMFTIAGSLLVLGSILFFEVPFTDAATYGYVTTNGNFQVTAAQDPEQALRTALNRAPDSGVMLMSDARAAGFVTLDTNTESYMYVSQSGEIKVQVAENPDEALMLSTDRASDSGVARIGG